MTTAIPFGHTIERATDNVKPWIERLARVGFVAKAILYFTIGGLAAWAALWGNGRDTTDTRGAMGKLFHAPFGRVLLGVIAVGLVGYAIWRIIDGIADPERRGRSAKAIAVRAGSLARGLVHLALAGTAASLAVWQRGGQGDEKRHWTQRALELPGGEYLLWAIAGGLVGYGLYQLSCAVRAKLSKQLELGRSSRAWRSLIVGVSRFGIAARAIVFGTIGVLLGRAAAAHDARQAGGIGESLRELSGLGKWPFVAIALGVVAYGMYQLVEARYRRIRVAK